MLCPLVWYLNVYSSAVMICWCLIGVRSEYDHVLLISIVEVLLKAFERLCFPSHTEVSGNYHRNTPHLTSPQPTAVPSASAWVRLNIKRPWTTSDALHWFYSNALYRANHKQGDCKPRMCLYSMCELWIWICCLGGEIIGCLKSTWNEKWIFLNNMLTWTYCVCCLDLTLVFFFILPCHSCCC